MRVVVAAALALACAAQGGIARAQDAKAEDALQAIIEEVCLPLVAGERPVAEERVAGVARAAGLTEVEGRWYAYLSDGTGVAMTWEPSNNTCGLAVGGPIGTGVAIFDRMSARGWGEQERNRPAPDGTTVDFWCAELVNERSVCTVFSRTTDPEKVRNEVAMTATVVTVP